MSHNSINFVPGHKKQTVTLSVILCVVGLLLGIAGVYTTQQAEFYKSRLFPLEKRLAALRDERQQYRTSLQDGPSASDVEALSSQIEILSNRLNLKGLWVDDILYELEGTIPDKAYLLQFHYPFEKNTARIVVRAENENLMSETLQKMEQSGRMSNVVLAGQSREEEGLQVVIADVRFTILRPGQ